MQLQQGCGLATLRLNIAVAITGFDWKPWLVSGKSGVFPSVPLHRRAAAVAAETQAWNSLFKRVVNFGGAQWDLLDFDFIAVADGGRAARCQEKHGGASRLLFANAAGDAGPGMIAKDPVGPSAGGPR